MRNQCNDLIKELERDLEHPGLGGDAYDEVVQDIATLRRYVIKDKDGRAAYKILKMYGKIN